jgi:hypothetical protein
MILIICDITIFAAIYKRAQETGEKFGGTLEFLDIEGGF